VAVRDGRIVEVGGAGGQLVRERVRAGGRVVAPGFIDPHTHYDAQVAWDPLVTCSSWPGVTTVVTGN
jgi:N-acyl-D-aspartate/D-glutamate deacylase